MADFSSEQYDKAYASIKGMTEESKKLKETFSALSTDILGISGSAFSKEVPKTTAQIQAQRQELDKMRKGLNNMADDLKGNLSTSFTDVFDKATDSFGKINNVDLSSVYDKVNDISESFGVPKTAIDSYEGLKQRMDEISKLASENTNESDQESLQKLQLEIQKAEKDHLDKVLESQQEIFDMEKGFLEHAEKEEKYAFARLIADGKHSEALAMAVQLSEEGFVSDKKDLDIIKKKANALVGAVKSTKEMGAEVKKVSTSMFDLSGGIEAYADNVRKKGIASLLAFDEATHDAQKTTGIMFTENSDKMASLASTTAGYGMSIGETTQMMEDLGDELRTTDFNTIANATKDFAAISLATGVASKDISRLGGEMMRMGSSSEDVEEAIAGANVNAKLLGVSSKKVIEAMSKNIDKMRTMGFTGGEASLARMAAQAERLQMNVDSIFDMSKKARNIEGAMDMAAQLQLAGGSFAQIDPMSLLSAARKGPEEMQKILSQMGDDIGSFNDDGDFQINPIDADRLKMVEEATGVSVDSLTKMITKNAEDSEKLRLFPGVDSLADRMSSGLADVDKEMAKSSLLGMMNNDGMINIGVDGDENFKKLSSLSDEEVKNIMQKKIDDASDLKAQAEANKSFKKSMETLVNSFMAALGVFQPFLNVLGEGFQLFFKASESMGVYGKAIVGGILMFGVFGSTLISGLASWGGGFLKGMKGAFKFGKDLAKGGFKKAFAKAGNGLRRKGNVSPIPEKGKPGDFLTSIAKGLKEMGAEGVLKGIGNLAISIIPLVLFAAAIPTLLLMALVGKVGDSVEKGFRATGRGISAFGGYKNIYKGTIAMGLVGLAMIPFAGAMMMLASIGWTGLGVAIVGMAAIMGAIALIGIFMMTPLGAATLTGAWALVAIGATLVLASVGLLIAAEAFDRLAAVNWGALAPMGDVLPKVGLGLAEFALSAMLFANPISLLGMVVMAGALLGLVAVMSPLASALSTGATGMNDFAGGVENLKSALDGLSLDKLEALEDTSYALAAANVGSAINSLATSVGSFIGGSDDKKSSGSKDELTINLKLNGRDLQQLIVQDNKIISGNA